MCCVRMDNSDGKKEDLALSDKVQISDVNKEVQSEDKISLTDVKYDKVVAYDFEGNTDISLVDTNYKLTTTIKKVVLLNKERYKELVDILSDTSTFNGDQPLDFYPHFGVAFYRKKVIVNYFEISLMCNGIFGDVKIPGLLGRKYPNAGFSKMGRERIYSFCKNLGFKESLYLDRKEWCCE